ncbi:hypothetical protein MYX82_12390 [Acidobacteria bacterium AH-259-D05]|nr:hypothetical protein [Acidobacteria bacterium AH-259-D05]
MREKKKKDRRKFLKRSVQAILVAPAMAASRSEFKPLDEKQDAREEVLPGDPGTRDTEAYGSVSE